MKKRARHSLYKYTDVAGAKFILRDLTLLFKTPDLFNDPNDCDFVFNEKRARKAFSLIEEYLVLADLRERLEKDDLHYRKGHRPMFAAWKRVLDWQTKECALTHQFGSNPVLQLFIFQQRKKVQDYAVKREVVYKEFLTQMKDSLVQLKKKVFLCCFSKKPDSILMWSHYADEFRGVCIEWSSPSFFEDLNEVKYSQERKTFDIYKAVRTYLGYQFGRLQFDENDPYLKQLVLRIVSTKGSDWSYEEETRWIVEKDAIQKGNVEILGEGQIKLHIDSAYPTKVYLGERIGQEDERELRSICQTIGCKVIKTKKSETAYEIIDENGRPLSGR